MRRYLALTFLLFLAIPAGVSISGCVRNPAGNYCNGLGFGLKDTQLFTIDLEPRTTGISLAFGQTRQVTAPTGKTCKGDSVSISNYTYGTTNNQLVDLSPTGNICAGRWNRNSGGGIADYTICNTPSPLPSSSGLPFSNAFITASAESVTSNPVEVYVHAPVSAITLSLAGQQACYSQGTVSQLDSEACFASNGKQYELCAPATVTSNYSCSAGLPPGVTSVPDCTGAIGVASYTVGTSSVADINAESNQITAELPGTTEITASVAGSGSSAGYFSTCPPKSISVTLANGKTSGVVTQGVQQNLTTTVIDTLGNSITGLTLDYQSTNPLDITAGSGGGITPAFPGSASVYAICQPSTCNPAPINQVGAGNGTGLSISSNAVNITTPGTASAYVWYSAPGQSQYFVPIELLTGTVGSTVRLPYVPNSMVMDQTGTSLYFGSSHELMIFTTTSNSIAKQDTSVPGVVLSVSPNGGTVLINDQSRQVFYLYATTGLISATFGGMGTSAQWTPDSKTLYITDSAATGPGHSDTLYVYNANTGWTTYDLSTSGGARHLALMIPGVGAYLSGDPTVAHTWCPSGTLGNYASMVFYPQGDSVPQANDVVAATPDGQHILGAAFAGGSITLNDISISVPSTTGANGVLTPTACPPVSPTSALTIAHTVNTPQTLTVTGATSVNQIVTSPSAVAQGAQAAATNLSFVTYNGTAGGAALPYYTQTAGSAAPGTVGYITLNGASVVTAPIAGAFSNDGTLFFVSTSGDNLIHYINTTTLQDTQQIAPNLPACAPGSDPDCTLATPQTAPVPATAIAVKPRSTT
jgi:trimeric autotransporter adhesin